MCPYVWETCVSQKVNLSFAFPVWPSQFHSGCCFHLHARRTGLDFSPHLGNVAHSPLKKATPALTPGHREFSSELHAQPTEYQHLPGSTIPQEDYRCWPSYHHGSCLLSVFNLAEAVDICESHAQCQAFVVTNQTTWTGEPVGKDILREVTGLPGRD